MNTLIRRSGLALLSLPLFAGCASWRASFNELVEKEASEQYESVDRHSSYAALRRRNFEQVNLLEMIDPNKESGPEHIKGWDKAGDPMNYGHQYDLTLSWFRTTSSLSETQKAVVRDGVQDKILAVSTSRCNVFKTFLRRQQTDMSFLLGSLTTVSGVLGAVLPGVRASRNLAGAAGLFSGIEAEYNQAYFSNLAAHVIVQGIELRQNRFKQDLINGRRGKVISEYSMEAAINDAIVIDGNCSALAGLIEAQDSIKEVETPGLRMAARATTSSRALQELQSKSITELQASGNLEKLMVIAGGKVPSLLVTSIATKGADSLDAELAGVANVTAAVILYIDSQAEMVAKSFDARRKNVSGDVGGKLMASDVATEFKTVIVSKLKLRGDPPAEPFLTCSVRLKAAAGDLGLKVAELNAVKDNVAQVAKATNAKNVSEAKFQVLLAQVNAVKSEVQAQIDLATSTAIGKLPPVDKLKNLDAPSLKDAFKDLAVDAAKISSNCN